MSASAVRAGNAFVEIGARDRMQAGLRSSERRLRNFGSTVSGIGRTLGAVGTAGTVAIGAATSVLVGFDKNMAEVAAKTGAVGGELEALRDKAKELGASTQFSARQAAQGMTFLAQAGFNAKQILAGIPDVLSLAAAGGIELGEAADIATDVGSAFGKTADQLGNVADIIALTASKANTSVSMMGETFKFVAPVARAAGQALDEVSIAAGVLGNNGVKASSAGTDLKNILANLSKIGAQKKLHELGVEVKNAEGEFRPLTEIMRDFGEVTRTMKGPERLALFMNLFGKISAKSALILADNADQVDTLRAEFENVDGAAARMATTMQEGVHGSLTSLMSAAEGLALEFAEALKPAMQDILDRGTALLRWATGFIKENKGIAIAVAGTVVGLTVLGGVLLSVGAAATAAAVGISAAGTVIGTVSAIVSTIGLPLLAIAAAVAAVGAAFVALGGYALYSSGILSEVAAGVKANWSEITKFVTDVIGGIAKALRAGDIKKAAAILFAALRVVFWTGTSQLMDAFARVPEFMTRMAIEAVKVISKIFASSFGDIARGFQALATGNAIGLATAAASIASRTFDSEIDFSFNIDDNIAAAKADLDRLLATEPEPGSKDQSSDSAETGAAPDSPAGPNILEIFERLKQVPGMARGFAEALQKGSNEKLAELLGDLPDLSKFGGLLRGMKKEVDQADAAAAAPLANISAGAGTVDAAAGGVGSSSQATGTTSSFAAVLAGFNRGLDTDLQRDQLDALQSIDKTLGKADLGAGVAIA